MLRFPLLTATTGLLSCFLLLSPVSVTSHSHSHSTKHSTILETIDSTHELSLLSEILAKDQYVNVREILKSTGPITFFAPTNSALTDLVDCSHSKCSHIANSLSPSILLYHLSFGSFDSESLNSLNFVTTAYSTSPSHTPAVLQIQKQEKVKRLSPKAIDSMTLPDRPINPSDPVGSPAPKFPSASVNPHPSHTKRYPSPPPSDRDLGLDLDKNEPVIQPDNASVGSYDVNRNERRGQLVTNQTKADLYDALATIPTVFAEHRHKHEKKEKVHMIKLRLGNGIAGVNAFTSRVVLGDIHSTNGVLHIVDTVMNPPAPTTHMLEIYNDLANRWQHHHKNNKQAKKEEQQEGQVSGVNGFLSMIDAADMWNEIDSSATPITLFAPSDTALGQIQALDKADLRSFIRRHIVQGRYFSSELSPYTETQTVQQEREEGKNKNQDELVTEIRNEIEEQKYAYQLLNTLSEEQVAVYEKHGKCKRNKAHIQQHESSSAVSASSSDLNSASSELSSTDYCSSVTPLYINNARLLPFASNILAANSVIHIIDAPIQTKQSRKEEERAVKRRQQHRKEAQEQEEKENKKGKRTDKQAEADKQLEKDLKARPAYEQYYAPYEKFFHPYYSTEAPHGASIAKQEKASGSADFFPTHHAGDVDQRVDARVQQQQQATAADTDTAAVAVPQMSPFDYSAYYRPYMPAQLWSSPSAVAATQLAALHHQHKRHSSAHPQRQQAEQTEQKQQKQQKQQEELKDWQRFVPPYQHYDGQQPQQPQQPQQLQLLELVALHHQHKVHSSLHPQEPREQRQEEEQQREAKGKESEINKAIREAKEDQVQVQEFVLASTSPSPSSSSNGHARGDDSASVHRDVSTIIVKGDNARIYGPQAEQPNQSPPDFSKFIKELQAAEEESKHQHSSKSKGSKHAETTVEPTADTDKDVDDDDNDNDGADDEKTADLIDYLKSYGVNRSSAYEMNVAEGNEAAYHIPLTPANESTSRPVAEEDAVEESESDSESTRRNARDRHFISTDGLDGVYAVDAAVADSVNTAEVDGTDSLSRLSQTAIYMSSSIGILLVMAAGMYVCSRRVKLSPLFEVGNESERQTLRGGINSAHTQAYNAAEIDPVDDSLYSRA